MRRLINKYTTGGMLSLFLLFAATAYGEKCTCPSPDCTVGETVRGDKACACPNPKGHGEDIYVRCNLKIDLNKLPTQ